MGQEINYIQDTMGRKVIYVYKKNYDGEENYLKIGDASVDSYTADFNDNSDYLMSIAEKRIREYDRSSDITILSAIYAVDNQGKYFRDYQVHEVLTRNGINKITKGKSTEWFETDLATVINAIDSVKNGNSGLILNDSHPNIKFRPEQENAIKQTIEIFKTKNDMLWNAKMRFGKTLSALEVIKRQKYKRTLILTHRPIVNDGWFKDFDKIFTGELKKEYKYGSREKGEKIERLLSSNNKNSFIYFASVQDLRGSSRVNVDKGFEKNDELFDVNWDLIIIDEAHEGTTTNLAQSVLNELKKTKTKTLQLSGTPFNLLDNYDEGQIYTWDYVMEQEAKLKWSIDHEGDSNPYSSLPEMKMFVYELGNLIQNDLFVDYENKAFNFAEFFRVDDQCFVYEKEVWSFLNLITRSEDYSKDKTNMPYSTSDYRSELRHTIWTMPSRASTVAMEELLKKHPVFHFYNIANLTDDGDSAPDLQKIRQAITNEPENTFSITLTVRKGTVGTTVSEWTGILVLNNTESASNYLQSIFRVQSPYKGKEGQKEKGYVFDFAPDRSLKMVSEAAKLNTKGGSLNSRQQENDMKRFLNFFPIIGIDGSQMKSYNVKSMLTQLKRAQAERAVRNGFDDTSIYSDELLRLTDGDLKDFANLKKIVGQTKQSKTLKDIDINKQGLSDEEWSKVEQASRKAPKERSDEEKALLEKRKELSKQKQTMISILRGISIRIPLMMYGMNVDINSEITIDNFVDLIDNISWNEFMPAGVTKGEFAKFKKYYDTEIFIEAGNRIRNTALSADKLSIEDRIDKIAGIFSGFKNPDKETILTPWRVVNMHMGETLGGYNFFDSNYPEKPNKNQETRYIYHTNVTEKVFSSDTKILEINSKSGLYPLYMAYSIYKTRWLNENGDWSKSEWIQRNQELWQEILENNIFVLNKTPMARTITYRTLNGYKKNDKVLSNLIYVEELTVKLKQNLEKTKQEILDKFGGENMKFDVVVGNPPYQENDNGKREDGSSNASASPLYHLFFNLSKELSTDITSLIFPARWLSGAGKGMGTFSNELLNDRSVMNLSLFKKSCEVFPNTDIKGGVLYLTYKKGYDGMADITVYDSITEKNKFSSYLNSLESGVFIPYGELISIFEKVNNVTDYSKESIQSIASSLKPYGLRTDFFRNQKKYNLPEISDKQQLDSDIAIIGLEKGKRVYRYIPRDYPLSVGLDTIDKWKLFVGKATGSGELGEKIADMPIGKPSLIATETFIRLGTFESEYEVIALKKYYHTKFFRCMLGILKTTQDAPARVYKFVPLQNFNKNSDINWNKSISDIDAQLYKKYNLNKEEIDFIESKVTPMEFLSSSTEF